MIEKPILLSGETVRAILDGRKTQTRVTEDYLQVEVGDALLPALAIPSLGHRYCADTFGRIWSKCSGEWRRLLPSRTGKGYLTVTPAVETRYKTQSVHKLVAEAFYGYRSGMQVRHLNGDQTNNAPENLDWGTQQQNWSDRAYHGRGMGERHHNNKLTTADASAIRESRLSQRQLAKEYGVSQSAIWCIRNSVTWRKDRTPDPPNMPRWVSRITLQVTRVRIERLQDISQEDAIAEGAPRSHSSIDGVSRNFGFPDFSRSWFAQLWQSINGPKSWAANPWVWVYEFERKEVVLG